MGATKTIVAKALKDAAFRKRLVKDPKATIEQELGIHFPAGVTVQVHENSGSVVHLVLPGAEVKVEQGLTEEELSRVAGGVGLRAAPVPTLATGPTLQKGLLDPPTTVECGAGALRSLPGAGGPLASATFGAYTACCS